MDGNGAGIKVGRASVKLDGNDLVKEEKPVIGRTKQTIIPLGAVSSIGVDKEENFRALAAGVVLGFLGVVALANGAGEWGIMAFLFAGLGFAWWRLSRSFELVVESPTGRIAVKGKASYRERLEAFAARVREMRQATAQDYASGHTGS